jgi:TolB-like protein/Tfp pilus assembly protein PilF
VSEIFVSYSRSTEPQARRVAEALTALGYDVWRDDQLLPHRPYLEDTQARLETAKAVLVLWSKAAVKSEWVRSEANQGRQMRKVVQVSLDGSMPPMPFDQIQCAWLQGWDGDPANREWQNVLTALAELVPRKGRGRKAEPAPREATAAPPLGRPRRIGRRWGLGAAVAVVAAALALGVWLSRDLWTPQHPSRIAVLPFDVIGAGGQEATALANALLDDLVGAFSQDRVQAMSRSESLALRGDHGPSALKRLDVGYALGGDVERAGETLRVRMHLEDPHAQVTLWSRMFEGPVGEADALARRATARATLVAKMTQSPKLDAIRGKPSVLATFIEAQDEMANEGNPRAIGLAREVVAQAPRLAIGHALLSAALAGYTTPMTDVSTQVKEMTEESSREARRALALDPADPAPYGALASNLPFKAWVERDRLLQKGLAVDPHNGDLAGNISWFLMNNVGRNREAVDLIKQAMREQAYQADANLHDTLAVLLVNAGRADEAAGVMDEARRLWPDYWEIPLTDFPVALARGDYDRALVLLEARSAKHTDKPAVTAVWRLVLHALSSKDEGARQAALDAARTEPALDYQARIYLLSRLGDIDGAFRIADQAFTPEALAQPAIFFFNGNHGIGFLWGPATLAMRRDIRFMALANRLGLVDYWRTTGHWPDYCSEPGLPYDCKAEAAKLAKR